jgi:simple sugar transport system ATP-binding protein
MISLRGVTKRFPSVLANDRIDLDLRAGEIHGLLGENGAGKSTLLKVLFGFYRADAGEFLLDGQPVSIKTPRDARRAGIGMVFQDLSLIPAFTVAENIALFLPGLKAVLDPSEIERRIAETSARYGLEVEPGALVSQLSIGTQQKVEILKLLLSEARLLILDEATRVLAPHEVTALFEVLDNLRSDNYAIVLITHKLREVLECADRITVLRNGRVAGSLLRTEATDEKLVEMMFEKALPTPNLAGRRPPLPSGAPVLELCHVSTRAEGAGTSLHDIELSIHAGEIVGIAGVSGNGQKELCDAVLGMERCVEGVKLLSGRDLTNEPVHTMRSNGVAFVPENPLTMASVPFMTVLENMALTRTAHYARRAGFAVNWQAVEADMNSTAQRLGFPVMFRAISKSLSGGNLQRMVIVRELTHDPQLILASYLTRGLDVQSAIAARQALIQARDRGAGILLVSEDLEELFSLSDRLLVLYAGQVVGEFRPAETDPLTIGHLMTGSEAKHVHRQ